MITTQINKIDIIMSLVPDSYLFRGKNKQFSNIQREAISYTLYLLSKGWGITTASNRAGYKHEVSVQLLRRTINQIPSEIISIIR
jgi:hypothetical protein